MLMQREFARGVAAVSGACIISAKLGDDGTIAHVSDIHRLAFGERAGGSFRRVEAIAAAMAGAKFQAVKNRSL